MKMRSVMEHTFSRVPSAEIQRSSFDRSHGYKTTFDCDRLVPIFVDEALPGDTFNLSMTAFARLATPIFPIMDNMFMDFFFFFVPYRLVWDNWEKFNGAQDNPGDSTDFVVPQTIAPAVGGWVPGSVADYFGCPTGVASLSQSALPFRAYFEIYNEWFRDENLINSVVFNKNNGPDAIGNGLPRRRGKRHDYFTSALPWPQKGPSVSLPLGSNAPVVPTSPFAVPLFNVAGVPMSNDVTDDVKLVGGGVGNVGWNDTKLEADLSAASAATINQLRQAFAVQKLFERDARGGTRYTEIIRSHFGVISPDARLQRPEYLGGGSVRVNINAVAQTSSTTLAVEPDTEGTPQGNLAGFGTASAKVGFTKSFTEHGVIIGIANVRADLTYQQGLQRMWNRATRYDFYWPALAHIGEQAVLSKEIYADGTSGDDTVFGYQERYAEYRYKPSQVTGLFRSNHPQSLDAWHLSQQFGSRPTLGQTFIESDTPLDRCIAVPSEPHFIFDSYFSLRCARPMPLYGVPGFIDRF